MSRSSGLYINMSTQQSFVQALNVALFKSEVIDGDLPVLIDFWAPWCGPCRNMKPILEEASAALNGKVRVFSLNVDEEPALAQAFHIQGIPTLVVMKGSLVLDSWSGVRPLNSLLSAVDLALAKIPA